jgi:hypothetical protein
MGARNQRFLESIPRPIAGLKIPTQIQFNCLTAAYIRVPMNFSIILYRVEAALGRQFMQQKSA